MKFVIDDLEVIFPYKFLYKEQLEYMQALKQTLDEKGHGILEMPTGTGKTVSLLALIIAYLAQRPNIIKKLIYCTRTVVEMEKTLEEVRLVLKARKAEGLNDNFTAVGLSSRKNLCINPDVVNQKDRVDTECRKRTAEWVKRGQSETCIFYENFEKSSKDTIANLPNDVYSLNDLRKNGAFSMQCPYYTAREMVKKANIVVYNYLYLIDPTVSSSLSKDQIKESVVVFDEAHNIDDVCIEAYTVRLNKPILAEAINNLKIVETQIQSETNEIQNRLNEEYKKLIKNLEKKPEGELNQLVIPGQIRKARNFIDFMKRVINSLRKKLKDNSEALKTSHAILHHTKSFTEEIQKEGNLDIDSLKQCGERLNLLMNTLQIAETDKFRPLSSVAQFVMYLVQYQEGFKVIFQSNNFEGTLNEKLMTLACFDSSLAMKNIFTSFQSVILTSGTMSPIEIYPKILDFKPVVAKSIDIELTRNSIQPIIVTMSEDGTELTSEFTLRNNEDVSRNYGNFLLELSENVPDGLIVFMPSYSRMEEWARQWQKDKYLEQISKNKVLFIESKDVNETSQKLQQYRKCCDVGRGAALFSIARGKIAEGIDFEGHYGRCVAVIGFPALNSKDTLILERCKFLEEKFKITKNDFIEFDAMRQTCQCLGRVLRGKQDYGIMIMVDKRFAQKSKLQKMPRWIYKQLDQSRCLNITSETAITVVRDFFRQMAQPFKIADTIQLIQFVYNFQYYLKLLYHLNLFYLQSLKKLIYLFVIVILHKTHYDYINYKNLNLMIALKRQQFRAKQRQIVLNKLFQQNRMSSLLVFKLDKLEQILTQQHYDSLEYQESIQQIIMMSHNVNLSQLYHLLIQNFIDTIQYEMDVGYYVLSVQMEMAQQPMLVQLVKDTGIQQFLAFNDPMTLQFLELFLIQVPKLNDMEIDIIYNELLKWSQSINLNYVISALSCLNLLIRQKQELLSPDLSISILQLLNTEYSQLAFDILQSSNWQHFREEQLIYVWDQICKQLLNLNNEEISISILKSIVQFHCPYQLKEICQYLQVANDYYGIKMIEMLSVTQINRNYDQITLELLDQICYRVIKNHNLVPLLKQFLFKNKLIYESYNFPLQIEYLLQ